jgi:putative Holliday junction resolvase
MSGEPGIWFGVDVGTVRVGVARTDPQGLLAVPVTTLTRDLRTDLDLDQLAALVAEYEAAGVVVGLPRTLRDREGTSAGIAREYGEKLATRIAPLPVEYVDERLTTVSAQRKLAQGGVRGRAGRAVIDQAAAVDLLQHWLDLRRSSAGFEGPAGS